MINKKILITGAAGFIGSNLLKVLSKNNDISIIVRDKSSLFKNVSNLSNSIYFGDIKDFEFLKRVITEVEPNIVFHLASSAVVRMCARNPVEAYQNNVMGTVNLLESIRLCGDSIEKIIVSTSDKVYGHSLPPYDEETPFKPKYTYEATKACQDFVCQNYFHNYNLPISIIRLGNVYGPDDPNDSRLIPNVIKNILNNKSPIIYQDVAEYKRDFVFIEDAINAFLIVAKDGKIGEAYCAGSNKPSTIRNVVSIILDKSGSNLKVEFKKRNINFKEIKEQFLDSSKIQKLGWENNTTLEGGLEKIIKHFKESNK